jgi:hypothetical protein
MGWIGRRLITLGFAVEPWRRAKQKTGLPSVGNFEAEMFVPDEWRPSQYVQPFRKMALGDAYWGAKVVASFSDRQIAAAVDAAGYEDPRASAYLRQILSERRDKIARYWFARVAPLDFFEVRDGELHFHDLAVDLGLESPRHYEVEARGEGGTILISDKPESSTRIRLGSLGARGAHVALRLGVAGTRAHPVRVELDRRGSEWVVTRVRHG